MLTNLFDYIRYCLYGILIVLVFFVFQDWQKEHLAKTAQTSTINTVQNNYIPTNNTQDNVTKNILTQTNLAPNNNTQVITNAPSERIIHITTDVMEADIDANGGNIIQVKLLKYPDSLNSKTPFLLLNNLPDTRYLAQSGLLSEIGPDTSKAQAFYTSSQIAYTLAPDQNTLLVPLQWKNNQGVSVTKLFTFTRNSYEIDMDYKIANQSNQTWDGNLYLQLLRKNTPPPNKAGFMSMSTYFGAAISTPEKRFQKISFKQMANSNLSQIVVGGWVAMIQHYFISAWIPDKNDTSQYFSRVTNDGLYTVGLIGPKVTVLAKHEALTHAKFYAGPTIASHLEQVAPGLQLTIDYGWLWFISAIIFWMMQKIYDVVQNWGWSIVLVTLVIKLLFFHLSAKSYRSMSAMKKLQPKIAILKERLGEDKQKFTQATLELYKKEKVNPMSGCLPILVQIPVFIGLYWVLIESVQLRQAPFILWIQDLSSKDPYYVLPILMGITMFLQQRLNPPVADPTQAKIMMFMPVVFTLMFMNFPAGLMLYWFVNNLLSFLQQWFIMHRLEKSSKTKR